MPRAGFTGISYPFRVNSQGGSVTSSTSVTDPTHIEESIRQIFNTSELERPMESDIYSSVDTLLFEPNDASLQALLKRLIVDALERLEDRIEVDESGIEFSVDTESDIEYLFANITYKIVIYDTYYTSTIKLGEVTV